jgi:hypothetical protein
MKLWFAFHDFVRMHRTDLSNHAREKRVRPDALERFDLDVDRAFAAVMERLAGEPTTRSAPWFHARSEPFLAFATRRPPGRRYRLCLLTGFFPEDVRQYASGLAELGHVVHVLTGVTDRHSTVDFEGGLWIHRIRTVDHFFSRELARIAGFLPFDAVQVCDGIIIDPDVYQYPTLQPGVLSVDDAVIELERLTTVAVG